MPGDDTRDRDEVLSEVRERFGYVPKLLRLMAASPTATRLYILGDAIMEESSLSSRERHIVQLAISAFNDCHHCTPAHAAAAQEAGAAAEDVEAVRAGAEPDDPELATVVQAARLVLEKRGWLDDRDLTELAHQGVYREKLYDIVALIGLKTISNYVNHIEGTPSEGSREEQEGEG